MLPFRTCRLFAFLVASSALAVALRSEKRSADWEDDIYPALAVLEHFFMAGYEDDAERGAELLSMHRVNERRALIDARWIYRKHPQVFGSFVTVSSDLYGYEWGRDMLGPKVVIEGAIETDNGLEASYSAQLVYRGQQWRLSRIAIE